MSNKEKAEAKAPEAKVEAAETPVAAGKKSKRVLFMGIGGVAAVALGLGGFFTYKTFLAPKPALSAKGAKKAGNAAEEKKDDHADAKEGEPGDAKKDAKGDAKKDAKGDANKDAKGDANKDAKGDAKKDDHGDAKKDEKGGAKKDDHGDAKKDEKGGAKKDDHGDAKKDEKGDGKSAEGKDKDTREKSGGFGETYDLPKLDLNLGNPLENRFLRLAITMEFHGGEAQKEEIKKREPQLKDLVITSVSSKTRMELLTEKGKERLRRELMNRFNEVLERPVKSLFFTDFLVE